MEVEFEFGEPPLQSSSEEDSLAERRLVYYLATESDKTTFKKICDQNVSLFGLQASKKRRRWQHRKQTLKKKPHCVKELFDEFYPNQQFLFNLNLDSQALSSPNFIVSPVKSAPVKSTPVKFTPVDFNFQSPTTRKPPSLPRPRNIMTDTIGADYLKNNKFHLYIEDPEDNPYGVFCAVDDKVKSGAIVVDQLNIYFQFSNINDAAGASFRLSSDGHQLIATLAAQPTNISRDIGCMHFFTTSDDEKAMDGNKKYFNELKVIQTTFAKLKKTSQDLKYFYYEFPDGISCNSDHFNVTRSNQLAVVPEFSQLPYELMTKSKNSMEVDIDDGEVIGEHFLPCIRIKLAIDGKARDLEEDKDEVSAVTDSLAAMKLKLKAYRAGK